MRYFTFAVAILWFATGVAAQAATITSCVSKATTVRTWPASCPSCTNTVTVADDLSSRWSTVSNLASSFQFTVSSASAAGATPVLNDFYLQANNLADAFLVTGYADLTCFTEDDTAAFIDYTTNVLNLVENLVPTEPTLEGWYGQAYGAAFVGLFESSFDWIVYYLNVYLYNARGCFDCSQAMTLNNAIANYQGSSTRSQIYLLCGDITVTSPVFGQCTTPCGLLTVTSGITATDASCSSCSMPATASSSAYSGLSSWNSIRSEVVASAFDTSVSLQQFANLYNAGLYQLSGAINIAISYDCMDTELSIEAYRALLEAMENEGYFLDNADFMAAGIPGLIQIESVLVAALLQIVSSGCPNCESIAQVNDAASTFNSKVSTFNDFQYLAFPSSAALTTMTTLSQPCQLTTTVTSVPCPSSLISSVSASASLTSSASSVSETSASDSSSISSESISDSVFISSSVSSSGTSSMGSLPVSSDSTSANETSTAPSLGSSLGSTTNTFTGAASTGYSNSSSIGPSAQNSAEPAASIYTATTSSSSIGPSAQNSGEPATSIYTATTSSKQDRNVSSGPSTGTFTSTTVLTEPCVKCSGGSATYTVTSVATEPFKTSASSARTFTTTTVVTEPCTKCAGGSTTYQTAVVVTAPCDTTSLAIPPTLPYLSLSLPGFSLPWIVSTGATVGARTSAHAGTIATTVSSSSTSSWATATETPVRSVAIVPSEVAQTSVLAANTGNRNTWISLGLLIVPAFFGLAIL